MKTTITTTSQATGNFLSAADDILDLIDGLGFTTEEKVNGDMMRQTIAQIIRQNIEGNTNYGYDLGELEIPRNGRAGSSADLDVRDSTHQESEEASCEELLEALEQENPCGCQCGCKHKRNTGE